MKNRSGIHSTHWIQFPAARWRSRQHQLKGIQHLNLLLATSPDTLPAVRVHIATMFWFCSRPVQRPNQLHHGGANPDEYRSTCGWCRVWLGMSVPVSGSSCRVILFMDTFTYPTAQCKILTFVCHYHFVINLPPSSLETSETCSLLHPEYESQWCVNNVWSSILHNLCGNWM